MKELRRAGVDIDPSKIPSCSFFGQQVGGIEGPDLNPTSGIDLLNGKGRRLVWAEIFFPSDRLGVCVGSRTSTALRKVSLI